MIPTTLWSHQQEGLLVIFIYLACIQLFVSLPLSHSDCNNLHALFLTNIDYQGRYPKEFNFFAPQAHFDLVWGLAKWCVRCHVCYAVQLRIL